MRATISRVAKTKTATVASEKKSSNASVSKKAPATQHIQWRGKRITLFGNGRLHPPAKLQSTCDS